MKPDTVVLEYTVILETVCWTKNHLGTSVLTYTMLGNYLLGTTNKKLCYSGQKCSKIPEALVKLYGSKVHSLDLSFNEISSLKGLDSFPLLQELILDNNLLSDSITIPYLPHLHTLSLNKNLIENLEFFLEKVSQNLPSLTFLSLLANKACPNQLSSSEHDENDYQRYRFFVLYHLPKLKFLDSSKVQENERKEAKRRGYLMKIVRPKTLQNEPTIPEEPSGNLTPLPKTLRSLDDQKVAFGKCRYRYSGKHSEGNRFISNNDL